MAEESYRHLLSDPRWQRRKSEIMQRDNFTCRRCGCTTKTLNVHHLHYIPGRMPWEYDDEELITLCEDCHAKEHGICIPKVGEVYSYDHSEYTNYMVCYGVNYHKGFVYLLGLDAGASIYDVFFFKENIDDFKGRYEHENGFWNLIYGCDEDSYWPRSLAYVVANISLYGSVHPNYYSYETFGFDEYEKEDVIIYAKNRIMSIVDANDSLRRYYDEITC